MNYLLLVACYLQKISLMCCKVALQLLRTWRSMKFGAPLTEFLFRVTCDCERRKEFPYHHLLCVSSLAFFAPAHISFLHSCPVMGVCTGALGISSVFYHSTHWHAVRAADVTILWLTVTVGVTQACAGLMQFGIAERLHLQACTTGSGRFGIEASMYYLLGLTLLVPLGAIFAMPSFYVDRDRDGGYIHLHFHFMVHILASCSMIALDAGAQACFGLTASPYPIKARWSAAASMVLLLVVFAAFVWFYVLDPKACLASFTMPASHYEHTPRRSPRLRKRQD